MEATATMAKVEHARYRAQHPPVTGQFGAQERRPRLAPALDAGSSTIVAPRSATALPQRCGKCQKAADRRLSMVSPERREAVMARARQMPTKCRPGYILAAAGRASPRAAIKAQCMECVGWVRSEVAACTALACPLWGYRPFKG